MSASFEELRKVFQGAVEQESAEDREAYLDRACRVDQEIRRQVVHLLEAHFAEGGLLGEGPLGIDATALYEPVTEVAGMVIGPYKLMEAIGEGGMGVVYVAEQLQPVRRRVALKIIKPGMDSKQVIARFEAERQAIAMMDHPNIARVHEAGTTESGRPYFVMELVQGIPITEFCDREQTTIPERLELFTQVCRAVQHAHQKGVIHRDLKPSNILVTVVDGNAVPKVIDFGVAKATGTPLTDRTIYTAFQQLIGTPLYMSPEQAALSGNDVDTRSDIYSLGVLLYELLTGTTPFDQETFRRASFDELRRIIREEDPPKPSTRLSTLGTPGAPGSASRRIDRRQRDRAVRGELDWIVMKALDKDRRRRYETANDFAADVQRFLSNHPVEACPPSPWYQFTKYARRHRAALSTTAVVGLALLAGTAVSVWQAIRATAAEHRTAALRAQAETLQAQAEERSRYARRAVDEMYTEVAEKWLEREGELTALQREFLEKALAFYESFAAEHNDDPQARLEAAQARNRVAKIRQALGQFRRAETSFRQTVAELELIVARYPANREYQAELARSLGELARQLGLLYPQPEEEPALLNRAIAIQESLRAADPANTKSRQDLADNLQRLVIALSDRKRYVEADSTSRAAIELYEGLRAESPGGLKGAEGLATAEGARANVLQSIGRNPESVQSHRRAIALQEELRKADPQDPGRRFTLARLLNNLGIALGRSPERIETGRTAIRILSDLAREFPERPRYRDVLLTNQLNQVGLLHDLGRTKEAEAAVRPALLAAERFMADYPDYPDYKHHLARALGLLQTVLTRPEDSAEVAETVRRIHERLERLVATQPDRADYRQAFGASCLDQAMILLQAPSPSDTEAARALQFARRSIEFSPEEDIPWKWLCLAEYRNRNWDAAVKSATRCIELRGDGGWSFMWAVLALAQAQRNDPGEARKWYAMLELRAPTTASGWADAPRWLIDETEARFGALPVKLDDEARESRYRILGPEQFLTLEGKRQKAAALRDKGQVDEAIALLVPTLEIERRVLGRKHRQTISCQYQLAEALLAKRRSAEALSLYEDLVQIRTRLLGPEHPDTLAAMHGMAGSLYGLGKAEESRALYARTLEIRRRVLGPDNRDTLATAYHYTQTLVQLGKYDKARTLHEQTLQTQRRVLGPEDHSTVLTMHSLAWVLWLQGHLDEARSLFESTLEIRRRTRGPEHLDTLATRTCLAVVLRDQGRIGEARAEFEQLLELYRRVVGPDHPSIAPVLIYLVSVLVASPDGSDDDRARALELARRSVERDPKNPIAWKWLAVAEYRNDHMDRAIEYAERSMSGQGKKADHAIPRLILALAYAGRGEKDQAGHWYTKARRDSNPKELARLPRWLIDEAALRLDAASSPGDAEAMFTRPSDDSPN